MRILLPMDRADHKHHDVFVSSFESMLLRYDRVRDARVVYAFDCPNGRGICEEHVARLVKSACHYFKFGKDVAKLVKSACHYFKIGGP